MSCRQQNGMVPVNKTPSRSGGNRGMIAADIPPSDELERAEHLLGKLHRSCSIAERHNLDRVTIGIDEANELCQLLADSLKTAKRIQGGNPENQHQR